MTILNVHWQIQSSSPLSQNEASIPHTSIITFEWVGDLASQDCNRHDRCLAQKILQGVLSGFRISHFTVSSISMELLWTSTLSLFCGEALKSNSGTSWVWCSTSPALAPTTMDRSNYLVSHHVWHKRGSAPCECMLQGNDRDQGYYQCSFRVKGGMKVPGWEEIHRGERGQATKQSLCGGRKAHCSTSGLGRRI